MNGRELGTRIRELAEQEGMPPCQECEVWQGTLEPTGGMWVPSAVEPPKASLVWMDHLWTVKVDGKRYAVGQDFRVIGYVPLDEEE